MERSEDLLIVRFSDLNLKFRYFHLNLGFANCLVQLTPDYRPQTLTTAFCADQILPNLIKPIFTMTSFQHPFQSLKLVKRQSQGLPNVLVTSAGPYIYSYAAESGQRLDVWPEHIETSGGAASAPASTSDDQAPPEKKIKLSSPENESEDNPSMTTDGPTNKSLAWTNILKVLATSDGKHVVALTAEDKCIRVFSLSEDGKFKELSSRYVLLTRSILQLLLN